MRRLLYALVGLLLLIPSSATAANWTTRGGDANRTHLNAQELGAIDISTPRWSKPVHIGATGAQPVLIGNKIYQLGGQSLWEIDTTTGTAHPLAGGFSTLSNGTERPSTSSIAYAELQHDRVLYFGTGNNSLCVFSLLTYDLRCHRLHPDATPTNQIPTPPNEDPIVTTPLVMQAMIDGRMTDFVTMGDKQGRLWVFQGFGALHQPYTWNYQQYDGWLLASMVEVSARPLTFVWGSTNGSVYAHEIIPGRAGLRPTLSEAWFAPVKTKGQIADGFAKVKTDAGEMVYALDSVGNLLQIVATTGTADTLHLNNIHFTNMSPAVDDQRIYLAIRETTAGTGALVAVDRSTFQEVWRSHLTTTANTNPLVLTSANAVLIGDTLGALHAFDTRTGEPKSIFHGDTPLYELAGLPAPLDPLGKSYQTLTGLSETILAGDPPMLVTGISGAYKGDPDGYLFVYRTLPAFDVGWVESELGPTKGEATLRLNHGPTVTVDYAFFWQPSGSPPPAKPFEQHAITLEPGKEYKVSFTPQTGPGTITGVVNPVALITNKHPLTPMLQQTTWTSPENLVESSDDATNNVITGEGAAIPDLAVRLQADRSYPCLGAKDGSVTFLNAGPTAVKASVSVRLGSRTLLQGVLTLAPGATSKSLILAGVACGSSANLVATVGYQDPALKEPDLTNNQASLTVSVAGAQEASGEAPTVIIVPADCLVNPDWTSSQPCLNYPGLIVP